MRQRFERRNNRATGFPSDPTGFPSDPIELRAAAGHLPRRRVPLLLRIGAGYRCGAKFQMRYRGGVMRNAARGRCAPFTEEER
jgi:hypothetical protein